MDVTGDKVDGVLMWLLRMEDRTLSGVVRDLGDRAGRTRYGINELWDSKLVPPDFFDKPPLDALEDAKAFYRKQFWDALNLDSVDMPFAASILSCAVNCGPGTAKELYRITVDLPTFIAAWKAHYRQLAANNPHDSQFLTGWLRRADAIYPDLP